jgi:glycosyltransferase involved in cell wall biosynthesis
MIESNLKIKLNAVILQRVIPTYRVSVFKYITNDPNLDVSLVIGEDLKEFKTKSAGDLTGIKYKRLAAKAIVVNGRIFTWHKKLLHTLRQIAPDVIICEAESHFLGYLTAIFYKFFFSPNTKLVMWCFFVLPGSKRERSLLHRYIKALSRRFFDGFISYATMGKKYLQSIGVNGSRVAVAVNVCDTNKFLEMDSKLTLDKIATKEILGVDGKFVVTYVGTLDDVKRPELVLEISRLLEVNDFHFFLVGDGPLKSALSAVIYEKNILNVTITGKITDNLSLYYRASDIVIIPGRGGIVISESMCFGVPVLVYQADGVEHDLVIQNQTGIITDNGSPCDFATQIKNLSCDIAHVEQMGAMARELIIGKYNTNSMANEVIQTIKGFER